MRDIIKLVNQRKHFEYHHDIARECNLPLFDTWLAEQVDVMPRRNAKLIYLKRLIGSHACGNFPKVKKIAKEFYDQSENILRDIKVSKEDDIVKKANIIYKEYYKVLTKKYNRVFV